MDIRKTGTAFAAVLFAVGAFAGDAKPQSVCPVMGGKINKAIFADADGKRVYFCCAGCIAPFQKDPAKYIAKIESEGVTLAKLQTTCPVMGGKINPKLYADYNGKRVFFCCPGCKAPFLKDPEKYIKKLEDEGVTTEAPPAPKASEDGGHGCCS